MIRVLSRLFAVLAAVAVAVPIAPTMAGAAGGPSLSAAMAEPSTPTVTWAVQPANPRGPDGRRWIERTLDAGQVVTEHLAVRNFSDRTTVFSLKAADGYLTDKGRFNMLPSDQKSVDGGTWIRVRDKVTVGPKATVVVPFTITVPPDATPGDHPAGIAATLTTTGGTVAVESRVGFRVMTRVSGTITASLAVDDLTTTYRHSWNPFSAGTIQVRYTTRNNGSVAVTGTGQVTTAGPFGLTKHHTRTDVQQTLPTGTHDVDLHIPGIWALGRLRTTVHITPTLPAGDTTGAQLRPTSATMTAWTLPWPQLTLAAILTTTLLTLRTLIRRRQRRLADLLARARAEGREEGLSSARPEQAATRP